MKILQLLPELKIGGVERGTVDLSNELLENNHVSGVVSAGGHLVKSLESQGAQHFKLPIAKKNFLALKQYRKLREIYAEFQPDIIHVRSRFPAWINFLALKNYPYIRPVVISTFHGLYSKPFYSKSMSYADEIITISKTVDEYVLKNYSVNKKNLHLIYRGCDLEEFNTSDLTEKWKKDWFDKFPQTKNKTLLTLPGRITSWKGIESFISLIKNLNDKNYHGLIPGPVSPNKLNYLKSLKKLVQQNALESQITFCGARKDIANIYKISTIVFNLSSKPEPFGRTIIEAAACGTRVMGWNRGGVGESINAINPTGLIPFGDEKALIERIPLLIKENCPQSIPRKFTKKYQASQTIALYEKTYKAHREIKN
jgi:glycosyltransferase involved in cell wall biosynthesis